jgi:hypothetical protein
MRHFTIVILLLVLSFCSCAKKKTTSVDQDEATVRFRFINQVSRVNVPMLHITYNHGATARTLRDSDFHFDSTSQQYLTSTFATPLAGTLSLNVLLTDTTGDTVSSGSAAIPLRPDWAWGIDIFPSHTNPYLYSFGVVGYQAFPLRPAYQDSLSDSLYLLWGGNSIKHPVIY